MHKKYECYFHSICPMLPILIVLPIWILKNRLSVKRSKIRCIITSMKLSTIVI